jgi:acetyl-CoA carboxylase biotin carboxyl carrier protein
VPRPKPKRRGKVVKAPRRSADTSPDALLSDGQVTELRRLIRLVQRTGIGELELSAGGRTVRISAVSGMATTVAVPQALPSRGPATAPPPSGGTEAGADTGAPAKADRTVAVTSPMVGTFYRAPAPDADPYVEMGDMIEVGQTACIIEAMKLMNEIESEVRGRIVQILVENAQPVEFGQKLFLVEPV